MMKFVFLLHHFEAVLREQLQRFDRCMLNSIEPSNPQGMSVTTSPINSWWGGSWSPKICSQTFPNTWVRVGFWMSRISWTVPVGVWNLHLKIHLQCDRYVVTRRPPSGFRKASFISLYLFMCIFSRTCERPVAYQNYQTSGSPSQPKNLCPLGSRILATHGSSIQDKKPRSG